MIATATGHNGASMLWGLSSPTLEAIVKGSLWAAGVLGVLAAISAFVAGYVGYELTDAVQRISDERVAEAQKGAATANEAAGKANASAAAANERAGRLEQDAALARLETANIMKTTAWRQLQPNQIEALRSNLSKHPGHIVLAWVGNDPESVSLAIQFSNVLNDSKWTFSFSAKTFPTAMVFGIKIPENQGEVAKILRDGMSAADVHFTTEPLPPEGGMSFGNVRPEDKDVPILLIGSKVPVLAQPPN
jgi:hypothetical protein